MMGHIARFREYAAKHDPQAARAEFVRLLGESVKALLEIERPTGVVHIKLHQGGERLQPFQRRNSVLPQA